MKWTSTLAIAFFDFILYLYQSVNDIQMDHCKDINHHTLTLENISFLLKKQNSQRRLQAVVVTSKAGSGGGRKTGIVIP